MKLSFRLLNLWISFHIVLISVKGFRPESYFNKENHFIKIIDKKVCPAGHFFSRILTLRPTCRSCSFSQQNRPKNWNRQISLVSWIFMQNRWIIVYWRSIQNYIDFGLKRLSYSNKSMSINGHVSRIRPITSPNISIQYSAEWNNPDHGLRGTLTWDSYVGLLRGTLTWELVIIGHA